MHHKRSPVLVRPWWPRTAPAFLVPVAALIVHLRANRFNTSEKGAHLPHTLKAKDLLIGTNV